MIVLLFMANIIVGIVAVIVLKPKIHNGGCRSCKYLTMIDGYGHIYCARFHLIDTKPRYCNIYECKF